MIAAIILAAGDSRRMGSPKALLSFSGATFIDHIMQQVKIAGFRPVVSVLGKSAGQILKQSSISSIEYVINPDPRKGMLSSIQTGLKHLPESAAGFLLLLVDHPFVQQSTLRALIETARNQPGRIIIPRVAGKHGHPVYFDRVFFQDLLNLPAGQSARDVIQKNSGSVIYLDVNDDGILKDIDTPQELEKYGL